MRNPVLAGAIGVALAAGMASSADAFDRSETGQSGLHGSRFTGVRGFSEWRQGGRNSHRSVRPSSAVSASDGHYRSLGPLGFTLDGGHGSGYGSSIAAWSW